MQLAAEAALKPVQLAPVPLQRRRQSAQVFSSSSAALMNPSSFTAKNGVWPPAPGTERAQVSDQVLRTLLSHASVAVRRLERHAGQFLSVCLLQTPAYKPADHLRCEAHQ